MLLTLDEGYLLRAAPPDLERGVALLRPRSHRSLEVGLLGADYKCFQREIKRKNNSYE